MIGETLGSYRVTAKLGEGGMGTVYAAEHVVLGRRAAIKLLLPSLSSNQELVQRFFNEARATATLEHAGLVQVFDFGHTATGSAFIVMEMLVGETVAKRLARVGRLDYASAAGFCRQATAAVGAAHAVGIVHRDLKPDNLFLVRDPEIALGERVKVLDFGIAKLTDLAPGAASMTRTGAVLGTPMYMSPEQCRGAGEVDYRSDIYSLGCILFEMVCGRPPYVGAGTGEIIGAHIFQERPSPRAFDPAIPPALDAIISRALEKDPGARQQSMQQLGAELEHLVGRGMSAPMAAASWPSGPTVPSGPSVPGWQAGPTPVAFAAPPAGFAVGPTLAIAPQTTLGGATGQQRTAVTRPRRWVLPVLIGSTLGIAGVVGAYVATHKEASAPATVATAETPERTPVPDPKPTPEPKPTPKPEAAPILEPEPVPPPKPEAAPETVIEPVRPAPAPKRPPPKIATVKPVPRPAALVPRPPEPPRPLDPPPASIPFAPRQTWSGRYVCGQGETALDLRIVSVQDNHVEAVFQFSHAASGSSGSFRVSGRYDEIRRRLALSPGAWIRRPAGYETVGLSGSVSANGSTYAGSVLNSSCSSFAVRR